MNTGMGFSFQVQNTCNRCSGKGVIFKETCPFCKGRRINKKDLNLTIEVEKGMKDNENIVFKGEAEEHPDYITGDLIVILKQKPHKFFYKRENNDLFANIKLNLKESILGYKKIFANFY